MDRAALRTELIDLLEDDTSQFETDRLDRAIQRAATYYHAMLVSGGSAIDYVRGTHEFTASSQEHDLSGDITDFDHCRYLKRKETGSYGGLGIGRAIIGDFDEDLNFARVIPESQRSSSEFSTGVDRAGRLVVFITPVLTLNWIGGAPGGTWTFVYARTVRQIPPNTPGASGDDLSYDTIPSKWHLLIPYRAALNIKGTHNENPDIAEQAAAMHADFVQSLKLGTVNGYSTS